MTITAQDAFWTLAVSRFHPLLTRPSIKWDALNHAGSRPTLDDPSDIYQGTMAKILKARVFMSGRSQAVRIPAEYRFTSDEVYIRRDPQTGDVILSQSPGNWEEIYATLDKVAFPDNFLADRDQGLPQQREDL